MVQRGGCCRAGYRCEGQDLGWGTNSTHLGHPLLLISLTRTSCGLIGNININGVGYCSHLTPQCPSLYSLVQEGLSHPLVTHLWLAKIEISIKIAFKLHLFFFFAIAMEKQNHGEFPNTNLLFCGSGLFKCCSDTALAPSRHKQLFETWTKAWKFGGCQTFLWVFLGCFFILFFFSPGKLCLSLLQAPA